MKHIFTVLKISLQILKCLNCAYKNDCPHSVFTQYKGKNYKVSIEPINFKKSNDDEGE